MQPVHAAPVPGSTCQVFPADNIWNTDISTLPVHSRSAAWVSSMNGATAKLHPDFGGEYGIPWVTVAASHPDVFVSFTYDDESDPGPYPFGADIPIEGGEASDGDRHAEMIDRDSCTLYELYAAFWNGGSPEAGSGAIFNLNSHALRPAGWTSADAAGLPIFAGLVRFDEMQAGLIPHAIRVTASRTDRSYVWPARHQAGAASDPNLPPMGARFRLKASYDISGFDAQTRVILTAMKRYGLILADNGSNWFFQGDVAAWPDVVISQLKTVPAAAFDAIDSSSLMIDPNSGQARQSGPSAPGVSVSPASLAFGSVAVGASTVRTLTVTSNGTAPLVISSATVSGTDFSETADSCAGMTLAPGATCTVTVRFAPTAAAARTGSVVIVDNASGSPRTTAITGTGTPSAPGVALSPGSITFPRTRVGNTSSTVSVTVRNSGTTPLVVGTLAFAGTHPTDFTKVSDLCSGKTLAAAATCTVGVRFVPQATGTRSGELRVSSNAAGSPHKVTLTGTGRRRL